jgi:hypothetical protein
MNVNSHNITTQAIKNTHNLQLIHNHSVQSIDTKMPLSKTILLAIAFTAFGTNAAPTEGTTTQELASAFNVNAADVAALQHATDLKSIDTKLWTNPLGTGSADISAWDEDATLVYLGSVKDIVDKTINEATKVKRQPSESPATAVQTQKATLLGKDDAKARAQVAAAVAKAKVDRDSNSGTRRKVLECNNTTQGKCTVCAGICSVAWVSGSALCGGAALGAEAATGGGLTPAVALTLGGCLGLASSGYAACIVKCVG